MDVHAAAAPSRAPARTAPTAGRLLPLVPYLLLAASTGVGVVGAVDETVEVMLAGLALYLSSIAVAHLVARSADTFVASHGRYYCWTIWFSFAVGLLGALLSMGGIASVLALPIAIFNSAWTIWRLAVGLVLLARGKTVENPLPLGL